MAMNIWKKYWDLRTHECDFKTLRIFRKAA